MGQTDGSGVLACDWGLHGRGLAAGVQLSGVRRCAGCEGSRSLTCEECCGRGFTGVGEADVVCYSVFHLRRHCGEKPSIAVASTSPSDKVLAHVNGVVTCAACVFSHGGFN